MMKSDEAVSPTLEIENIQAILEESMETMFLTENDINQQMPDAKAKQKKTGIHEFLVNDTVDQNIIVQTTLNGLAVEVPHIGFVFRDQKWAFNISH